jgi:predicted amidophosphoribosyltransferase
MRGAVHVLEYDGLTPAARQSGQMLASAIAKLTHEVPGEMLVVPPPHRWSKFTALGFNQPPALAVEVLAHLRKTHPEWCFTLAPSTLMRLRATSSQAGLAPQERRLSVGGAFRVSDPAAVAGKHILVVDDILTTGAGARATARAMLQAGAVSVWIATLARRTGASAYNAFQAADDQSEIGAVPDFRARLASMYSQNQPSF